MRITFLGAAKGVTGSCHMIEACGKTFLIDCGLFQGTMEEQMKNYDSFDFNVQDIDFVILSHAHIDHSGKIPKLYKEGYRGKVYATRATEELCSVMLPDSGHIQEKEIEWVNRKRLRAGKKVLPPMYTVQDAIDSCSLFETVDYGQYVVVTDNLMFRLIDAGHMLGSAIIEIWVTEEGKTEKLVYSGDLGNIENPIICDPAPVDEADYLIMESTYGDRLHPDVQDESVKFIETIVNTIKAGGNVIIPSFAVGRTQELLFRLNQYVEGVKGPEYKEFLKNIPVVVDSPLAKNATEIFRDNFECYNENALGYLLNGDNPIDFRTLEFTSSAAESQALNTDMTPKIIISASGMCEAGRIKHHLKHNLWRPECTVLFVGYQAVGTLGRRLLEGEKVVKIFSEEIGVNANIVHLNAFSGHADQAKLVKWVQDIQKKPKKIFLVHGEEEVQNVLASVLESGLGIETIMPSRSQSYVIGKYDTSKRPGLVNSSNLKLDLYEQLTYLKKDFESMLTNVKYDIKSNVSSDELLEISGEVEKLREHIGRIRNKA
ncbi:MAG: MBL fold metallo-hydrolase [Clostridia bacterium]|nr:MBL fold metallo-hydrolase [Clostridia bacterium]